MSAVPLPPGVARAEPQCPFCMSSTHYEYREGESGPDLAWRADLGPGISLALRHASSCPRFRPCMGCERDAITGFYGLCWLCCEEHDGLSWPCRDHHDAGGGS